MGFLTEEEGPVLNVSGVQPKPRIPVYIERNEVSCTPATPSLWFTIHPLRHKQAAPGRLLSVSFPTMKDLVAPRTVNKSS